MKTVGIDKDITIADDLRFVLRTTDNSDYPMRPYRINDVTIYFVTREFTDTTVSEYTVEHTKQEIQAEYDRLKNEIAIKAKRSVRAASTANLDLSGLDVVDGVPLEEYDRVLVKNQSNPSENGIYTASAGVWARSLDADSNDDLPSGSYVFVEDGIGNVGSGWYLPSKVSLGSPIQFLKFAENNSTLAPDSKSVEKLMRLRTLSVQIENSKTKSTFFYKDAIAVKKFGGYTDPDTSELFPAWMNPDMVTSELRDRTKEDNILREAEDDRPGTFLLDWSPSECREGDYFICWSWRPTLGDEVLSSHMLFSLGGNTSLTTSIPTHFTHPGKYETLMSRYLPEMFKTRISGSDLTPEVIEGLNGAVARGFVFLEDFVNQMIDLLDANSTHEQLLPLLSNLFNLKLKSNDPTLWRRQIKKAVPQFKRKGTVVGLKEALGDIGMKFIKFTRLWQVVSEYTYQEHFDYNGSNTFELSKAMFLPASSSTSSGSSSITGNCSGPSESGLDIWYRPEGGEWEKVDEDSVTILSSSEILWDSPLEVGDSVRFLYNIKQIPPSRQGLENCIRLLPLMDDRDERRQGYPKKNWNVRLVEEDDPLFDVLVPVRHPIADPTVWGRIRTEFPYSENAYNMDEYNGSKRDSFNPCDIDLDFVDGCNGCLSSKFNLDLEVEFLSNDSLQEARQIVEDYMPFHAVPNAFNLYGAVNEFIVPSMEKIEAMVTYSHEDVLLAGEGQRIFNRSVDASELENVRRDILASLSLAQNPETNSAVWSGTIRNQFVSLFPRSMTRRVSSSSSEASEIDFGPAGYTHGFDAIGVNTTDVASLNAFNNSNLLEILGPTVGEYSISEMSSRSARIHGGINSSLVGPVVEYRVSNKIYDALNIDVEQADRLIFADSDSDFTMFSVVTQNDVDLGLSNEDVWHLMVGGSDYIVFDILPDGTLLLSPSGSSSSSSSSLGSGLSWTLTDGNQEIKSGNFGFFTVYSYGLATATSEDVRDRLRVGDYIYSGADRWRVRSFKRGSSNQFFIENYEDGTQTLNVRAYRRVIENKVGQIGYEGVVLDVRSSSSSGSALYDIEEALGISNGVSGSSSSSKPWRDFNTANLKENFLVFVGSGGNLRRYTILDIDGPTVTLGGPMDDYTLEGETVTFSVYKFTKENLTLKERVLPAVPGHTFNSVDRSGGIVITQTGGGETLGFLSVLLNSAGSGNPVDIMQQSESINFNIEYKE